MEPDKQHGGIKCGCEVTAKDTVILPGFLSVLKLENERVAVTGHRTPDVCGPYDIEALRTSRPARRSVISLPYSVDYKDHGRLAVQLYPTELDCTSAKYPEFASLLARAETFVDNDVHATRWSNVSPYVCRQDLVRAGFFRVQRNELLSDLVCCFMCGVNIHRWEKDNVPLYEHLSHSPNCSFAAAQWIHERLTVAIPQKAFADALDIVIVEDSWIARLDVGRGLDGHQEEHRILSYFRRGNTEFTPSMLLTLYTELAHSGFYYVGPRDETRCFACGITFAGWTRQHRPASVHAVFAPYCPMVRGIECGNIATTTSLNSSCKEDARAPDMFNREARRQTFGTWWLADEMADAGFFYLPEGDRFQCYACNGTLTGLHDDVAQTPKQIHACWFPKCQLSNK